jgi:hypothetical protein
MVVRALRIPIELEVRGNEIAAAARAIRTLANDPARRGEATRRSDAA